MIQMLTGMLEPTGGEANIYGDLISKHLDNVQQKLGLCQQFDVLTEMMTVKEHLYLVCDLKNVLYSKVEKTVNETLDIVMLKEFANK